MPDSSDAERIENVLHAALDYIAEKGWVHALGYHDRLGRGAFIVSTIKRATRSENPSSATWPSNGAAAFAANDAGTAQHTR